MKRILILLLCIGVNTPLFSHDMYIWPRFQKENQVGLAMFVEKEEVVWFESMTAGLRMDGPSGEANLTVPEKGDPSVEFAQAGTYMIGWQSEPIFIRVEPDIFRKYATLEGYQNVLEVLKNNRQTEQPGRERFTRFVKTYVQVGPLPTNDFKRPFGFKIEIIPLQNPCALQVNEDLDALVLYDGKPLPDHRIMATYDSYSSLPEDYAQVTRTDANGIARFRITNKGLWLIRSNQIFPLENDPEADWQSFWANFTFEVK
jgi:hypothetical protein